MDKIFLLIVQHRTVMHCERSYDAGSASEGVDPKLTVGVQGAHKKLTVELFNCVVLSYGKFHSRR